MMPQFLDVWKCIVFSVVRNHHVRESTWIRIPHIKWDFRSMQASYDHTRLQQITIGRAQWASSLQTRIVRVPHLMDINTISGATAKIELSAEILFFCITNQSF
jgi:hypothetical protein